MSSNPYAQCDPFEPGHPDYVQPQRTSALAVTSFVLSLICCLPGISLVGALLGGFAIIRISQSRGALSGRGLAIAGLIVGMLITMLWIGLAIGFAKSLQQFDVFGETLRAVDQRDYNRVRQMLTTASAASATDQRIEEFRAAVESEWGSYQRLPRGAGEWVNSYIQILETLSRYQQQSRSTRGDGLPIPVFFDNGLTFVLFTVDSRTTGPGGAAQSSNIAIFDQQGSPIWLVPQGTPTRTPQPPAPQAPSEEPPALPPQEPGSP